jgi:hypothetical protein
MANNFLIALGTAIGSAALLLSILFVCVKLFAPRKLDERIPISIPEPTVERPPVKPPIFAAIVGAPTCETSLVSILGGDVVLSDVVMPEVSGLEIAERLSQLGHTVPLVMMLTMQHSTASFTGPYRGKATKAQEPPRIPLSQTSLEPLPTR